MVRSKVAGSQLFFDFDALKPSLEQLMSPDEIFEQADESLLRRLGEDRRIERKPTKYSGSALAEYLCMWANTSPDGGLVALGVMNDGTFEGCAALSQEQLNKLDKLGLTWCPDVNVQAKRVAVSNLKGERDFVILFRVLYNPRTVVRMTNNKVFVRKGDSKIELGAQEVRELQADKGEISFEQEDCRQRWPSDFDEKAGATFASTVKVARGIADALTTEEVLILRHLGRGVHPSFRTSRSQFLAISVGG